MYKYILIGFLGFVLFCLGCKNYVITKEGGVRPKKFRYSYAKYSKSIDTLTYNLIDTNSIYINKRIEERNTIYTFYRFCSNGRVLYGLPTTVPPAGGQYNDFQSGAIGYYYCNNNKINIEIFGLVFSDYQYMKYEGIIKNDTLSLNKARLNAISKYNTNDVFIKTKPVGPLNGFPDW